MNPEYATRDQLMQLAAQKITDYKKSEENDREAVKKVLQSAAFKESGHKKTPMEKFVLKSQLESKYVYVEPGKGWKGTKAQWIKHLKDKEEAIKNKFELDINRRQQQYKRVAKPNEREKLNMEKVQEAERIYNSEGKLSSVLERNAQMKSVAD